MKTKKEQPTGDNKMTMTAKYAGTCKICEHAIKVGQKIEWTKESGASHKSCNTFGDTAPASKAAAASDKQVKYAISLLDRISARDAHDIFDCGRKPSTEQVRKMDSTQISGLISDMRCAY